MGVFFHPHNCVHLRVCIHNPRSTCCGGKMSYWGKRFGDSVKGGKYQPKDEVTLVPRSPGRFLFFKGMSPPPPSEIQSSRNPRAAQTGVVVTSYLGHGSPWPTESHLWASVSSEAKQWGWTRTREGCKRGISGPPCEAGCPDCARVLILKIDVNWSESAWASASPGCLPVAASPVPILAPGLQLLEFVALGLNGLESGFPG